jgi:signal transduction histidine kinase
MGPLAFKDAGPQTRAEDLGAEAAGRTPGTGRARLVAVVAAARQEREDALVRGLLSGVATFRWLAWTWMVVILAVSREELAHPEARAWLAYALAGAALAVTAGITLLLRRDPARLVTLPLLAVELAVAFGLGVGDQLAYNDVTHAQSLASTWPLAGIFTAGIAFGGPGGLLAGITVGLGSLVGEQFDPDFAWGARIQWMPVVSTLVLYALAGGAAGFAMRKLREAERRISLAQAREEIARTLHDGVLQTLALVQRRTNDQDVARLAYEQERELREFLFGSPTTVSGGGEVGSRLRSAAARFEDRYDGAARVVLAPDLPVLAPAVADALVGAVSEALANAGKHGAAQTVTVFAEPSDDMLFCSVKDDGDGFEPGEVIEGVGLSRSIRGRIGDVGGRVEIDGRAGRGVEVRCWVPV